VVGRGAHASMRGDPLMKPQLVDRSWGAKEPGGMEDCVEMPFEVSRYYLKKSNLKT
jgi:hypothetical protein